MSASFFNTSVGKKYIMGLTGLIWAGFVLGHMLGNLLMFVSPEAYNLYGHALTSGKVIYVIEAILILALISHVVTAIRLTIENKVSKGSRYEVAAKGEKAVSVASKTMAIQGSLILAFIILHIAGFKYGTLYETTVNGVVIRDLYRLIVEAFKQPLFVAWYVVCLALLGFHLSHGVKSIFQSFGLLNEKTEGWISKVGFLYGVIVAVGFISQPIYIFLFAE